MVNGGNLKGSAMSAVQEVDRDVGSEFDYLAPPTRETVRVLLVDADPIDRELIMRASRGGEQLDIRFTQCGSSGEAKASADRDRFDLAIVDYWLGQETSIPLIQEFQNKYNLPVVLLTGLDTPEVRRCGFRAGITGYLSKDALIVQAIESAALGVLYSSGARTKRAAVG
jgi:DNA-binding NarL/FixJ family response regulator